MLEKTLRFLEKFIPKPLYRWGQPIYHFLLAVLGNFIYRAPSKKMYVIGVTGTKGKTTTSALIAHILNSAGFLTGKITSVHFGIGDKEWQNETKQGMPGRFKIQRFLAQMVKAGCKYAVVETTSEGILQFRHRFIDYNLAAFTNLSPEHIERHGNFENYRAAKLKLFERVALKKGGIGVFNLDDSDVRYFLKPRVWKRYGFTLKYFDHTKFFPEKIDEVLEIRDVKLTLQGTEFLIRNQKFTTPLIGEFNVYNAVAAICVGLSQNIQMSQIQDALSKFKSVPGRLELINAGQDFTVIVDYAHEPLSLESVYKTAKLFNPNKIICVLGSQGGGRDKWKRSKMGELAGQYCDEIVLTNEDPYDENPMQIISDVAAGIKSQSNIYKILDRKKAIQKAISLAQKGDTVVLTGKGGEVWMCVENSKKIPWNEKAIVEEAIRVG